MQPTIGERWKRGTGQKRGETKGKEIGRKKKGANAKGAKERKGRDAGKVDEGAASSRSSWFRIKL